MSVHTESFAGIVTKNPVTSRSDLHFRNPEYVSHYLGKLKDGEHVTVIVSTKRPQRTDAQNRYYWGAYLPMIAAETGEPDLDRLHELFKGKFLTRGIVEVLGEQVRMKKSTAELNVAEFSEYIMAIESLTGVAAPPKESYGLEETTN